MESRSPLVKRFLSSIHVKTALSTSSQSIFLFIKDFLRVNKRVYIFKSCQLGIRELVVIFSPFNNVEVPDDQPGHSYSLFHSLFFRLIMGLH